MGQVIKLSIASVALLAAGYKFSSDPIYSFVVASGAILIALNSLENH